MSAATPPTPDGERSSADHISSNGARAHIRSESAFRLVVLGYITAITMPVIGFILGIVVATRPAKAMSKHGAWIIVVSIIASIVWILILTSGVLAITNDDLSY
jgi:hypothetical protein